MKFKNKYNISPEFESIFTFKSKEEEIEHEAKMLMFKFFSAFEKIKGEKPLKKKDLAKAINTSASFITQLYQGDKLVNLIKLAKMQDAYDFVFEIEARRNSDNYKDETQSEQVFSPVLCKANLTDLSGHWVFVKESPRYDQSEISTAQFADVSKIPSL